MIASPQLDLFPAPAPASALAGGPPSVQRTWGRATAPAVRDETLAILAARRGEWLSWRDFRTVIDRHQISSCFGHVIGCFAREGLCQERNVYHGKGINAERPGSPNYAGFSCEWSAA